MELKSAFEMQLEILLGSQLRKLAWSNFSVSQQVFVSLKIFL